MTNKKISRNLRVILRKGEAGNLLLERLVKCNFEEDDYGFEGSSPFEKGAPPLRKLGLVYVKIGAKAIKSVEMFLDSWHLGDGKEAMTC
jgi:hypothetical protein